MQNHAIEFRRRESGSYALQPNDDWQTRYRGIHDDEYQIYVTAAQALGWPVKTCDEWLQS